MQPTPRLEGMRRAYRLLRRYARAAVGKDHALRPDLRLSRRRVGTVYGGWTIHPRFRRKDRPVVYSVGLGIDISFDLAMCRLYGAELYGFDPTPDSLAWLAAQDVPSSMRVLPMGLAGWDGEVEFSPPDADYADFTMERRNGGGVAFRCKVLTFDSMRRLLGHDHVDVLKMDVEGSEYAAVAEIMGHDRLPDQLLIEYHHGYNGFSVSDTVRSVEIIRSKGYKIFYVEPNGREISFISVEALHDLAT